MPHPHLPKAPISEAVIEIRCSLPQESEQLLTTFKERVAPTYAKQRSRVQLQVNVVDAGATSTSRVDGLLLQHTDEPHIVQARFDGFAFSRLRPYDRWESMKAEAARLWEVYRDVFEPVKVTRLGLRFINTIDIGVTDNPGDTLNILPMLPSPVAPVGINSFTLHLTTEYPDFGAAATLLEHFPVVAPDAETATVLLDVDVYKHLEFDPADARIWEHLDQLRELKNFIFFSCLTPAAIKRYDP